MANPYNTLSTIQLETLNRIRHARKLGFLPSLQDCDAILGMINQLLSPAHTCIERDHLPCAACQEEYDS
jgi:hypothetical protein